MSININKNYIMPAPEMPSFLKEELTTRIAHLCNESENYAAVMFEGAELMYSVMFEQCAETLSVGETLFEAAEYLKTRQVKVSDEQTWKSGFSYGQEFRRTLMMTRLSAFTGEIDKLRTKIAELERQANNK